MRTGKAKILLASLAFTLGGLVGTASAANYVGSKKCKKCHSKQFKSWKKTKLFSALETLKAGQAAEAKTKAKLDPAKDYTKDEKCLGCHTVAFGKGGYTVGGDAKFEGVGCESCHGPGSEYNPLMKTIKHEKQKYKTSDLEKAGLIIPTKDNCVTCHDKSKSPTVGDFNFDDAKKKVHDHFELELKLKEG